MNIEWRDLEVVTADQEQILAPSSGQLSKCRILSVMGPSASGKTTFLNCLRETIHHSGDVRFNGMRVSPEVEQAIGFVEQDDIVSAMLSVRDNLKFLAELRFGVFSQSAKIKLTKLLSLMSLQHVADSLCGNLSAAERKRFCIARELLAEPLLLVCDEPLSGLCTTAGCQILSTIKELCDAGKATVIISLREASSLILQRFDDLILLHQGETIYSGSFGEVEEVFERCGMPRLPTESVAEFLIDTMAIDLSGCLARTARQELVNLVQEQSSSLPFNERFEPLDLADVGYNAPVGRQVFLLTRRFFVLHSVQMFTKAQLAVQVLDVAVAGMVFWQLTWAERGAYERFAVVNWILGHWAMGAVFRGVLYLAADWDIVIKEMRKGCYSLEAYYAARVWLLLPLDLLYALLWNAGLYWLSNSSPFLITHLYFQFVVCLTYVCFHTLGLCAAAARVDFTPAMTYGLAVVAYSLAWSGFYADLDRLPFWLSWLKHCNLLQYAVTLSMNLIFFPSELPHGLEFTCNEAGADIHLCEKKFDGTLVLTAASALRRFKLYYGAPLCLAVLILTVIFLRGILIYALLYRACPKVPKMTRPRSNDSGTAKRISLRKPLVETLVEPQEETPRSQAVERAPQETVGSRSVRTFRAAGKDAQPTYDFEGIELALLRMGAPRPSLD